MFDYSLIHWATFLSAAVLLNLAPGPDMAFIVGHTMRGGKRAGFVAMAGIWAGAMGHVVMAAVGLTAIVASSAIVFSVVKWLGAGYLIWMGISALRSSGGGMATEVQARPLRAVFRQGIWVALLNPKVAIFFLAFLPQFVVDGQGPVWAQLALHGGLIILVAGLVEPPLILLGGWISAGMRRNPRLGQWMDRALGVVLVSLGLKLALERQ